MSFFALALSQTARGAVARCAKITSSLSCNVAAALLLLPGVTAQGGYPSLNDTNPTYNEFEPGPIDPNDPDKSKMQADIANFMSTTIAYYSWKERVDAIRRGNTKLQCIGNLTIALEGLGAAYQAGAAGATTLLTLLPTAGVLIGAPAKELWVLYKLMPMAGVLSMMLSLGGNIVPAEINEYERTESFSYQGMMGTHDEMATNPNEKMDDGMSQAHRFAAEVRDRVENPRGSKRSGAVYFGMALQVIWLAFMVTACWFLQTCSIIVWWCEMTYWAYFWFVFVVISSLLENMAGVPFSRQYTIRVSRAPKVIIDDSAPWVISEGGPRRSNSDFQMLSKAPTIDENIHISSRTVATPEMYDDDDSMPGMPRRQTFQSTMSYTNVSRNDLDILAGFKKGYNTHGRVVIDHSKPWSAQNEPFYVIISIKGISRAHAALRVFSKLLSIAVFTVGTAFFASSTLLTIMAAVITAALILCAGVFGRVTAMWMASVIMQDKPVIQRVVESDNEAEQFMDAMLRGVKDCIFEIQGHVVLNGRCIKRYGHHLRWSKFLGVLAKPYDITRLATTYGHHRYARQR